MALSRRRRSVPLHERVTTFWRLGEQVRPFRNCLWERGAGRGDSTYDPPFTTDAVAKWIAGWLTAELTAFPTSDHICSCVGVDLWSI